MENNEGLNVKNVTMKYANNCGIKDISVTIGHSEIVAFVGPNGVGKTTLLKTIAGLIKRYEGEITFDCVSTTESTIKKYIGYMQDDLSFYEKMTVYEILDFINQVKYNRQSSNDIEIYLKKYGLYEKRNTYINNLSLGMQKKLAIVMALIGNNRLIILDEPTNGVDTAGILQLKQDLQQCVKGGAVVLISSHVLEWIEKICTRCIFLKEGQIVSDMRIGSMSLEEEYERLYL